MLGMTTGPVHARNTFGTLLGQKRAVAEGRVGVPLVTARAEGDAGTQTLRSQMRFAPQAARILSERECKRVRARSNDGSVARSRGQLPPL
jgi:hypothetical protein